MNHFIKSLIAAVTIAYSGAFANLLVNGSFEGLPGGYNEVGGGSGAIAGWTTTRSGVEWFDPSAYSGGVGFAADGSDIVDLANWSYTQGGISQSFASVAGESYTVTFSASNFDWTSSQLPVSTIQLAIDGAHVSDYSNPTAIGPLALSPWIDYSYQFTATSNVTMLEFYNTQDARYVNAFLDNVDVEGSDAVTAPVPEPGTLALLGLGLFGLAARRFRRA